MEKHVEKLIEQAAKATTANEAQTFSQAACNAANALRALNDIKSKP